MQRSSAVLIGFAGIGLVAAALGGCSATSNSASPNAAATLHASQDGTTTDTQVYNPFYMVGANYAASTTVTLTIYVNNTKTNPVFSSDVPTSASGALSYLVNPATPIPAGDYDAYTYTKGTTTQLAKEDFTDLGPRSGSVAHVVTDAKTPAGAFFSPAIRSNQLYISQSANGGQLYRWPVSKLPTKPSATPVVVAPETSAPQVASGVKMEQIAFDSDNKNLFIAKKALNAGNLGGNSVWTYPWDTKNMTTTGAGTNLAGLATSNQGDGYYAWGPNPSGGSIAAYNAKAFPPPDGTKTPTQVAIGNGGGVTETSFTNGKTATNYLYFGSLQSGCVYKQNMTTQQTWVDYCIPSLGVGNYNQSVYSLDTDKAGNVYAMWQGSQDNNTIIMKIVPGGDGQTTDKLQTLQIKNYMLSSGMAVNTDGTRIFADGSQTIGGAAPTVNADTILELDNPVWGAVGSPDKPAGNTPIATQLPQSVSPWLTGLNLVDKSGNKGDKVYIADNNNGFWMFFL